MNNNIDSFIIKSEEINSKINRIEEDYQKNIVDQKQYQDMLKNITLEKEKMYKSYLLIAKNTIKDNLNIEFSAYHDINGYSSSLKRINTIEAKTKDELLNDINTIKKMFNNSNVTDKSKLEMAIQILEEYYIANN